MWSYEKRLQYPINIKFTTVQQLHEDLNKTKENCTTLQDYEDIRTVLIADEAHHLNADTKKDKAEKKTAKADKYFVEKKEEIEILRKTTQEQLSADYESLKKDLENQIENKEIELESLKKKYLEELEIFEENNKNKEKILEELKEKLNK